MLENIRLSFQGIWSHKMRSFLTMLGIIIGIAAIIAIVSTIQGTNEQIKQNLIGSGNNVVEVQLYQYGSPVDMTYESLPDGVSVLTESTRQQVMELPEVENVSLYLCRNQDYNAVFHLGTALNGGKIIGADEHYLSVYGYQIYRGRGFDKADYQKIRKVALLDEQAAKTLFNTEDPLGKTIEIKKEPFTVVGLIRESNTFTPSIDSVEDYYTYYNEDTSGMVVVPSSVWPVIYRFDEPQNAAIKAVSTDDMTAAGKEAVDILNAAAGLPLSVNSDGTGTEGVVTVTEEDTSQDAEALQYKNEDLLEQAKQLQEMSASTNRMLVWIASISLLVGGIGVMNIMLVSVTERTREIGLKKAIGAKKSRILGQFLTEAAGLTSLGGVLGIVLGLILSKVISVMNHTMMAISVPSIIVAVLFSTIIGIVFGLLPSVKAANLNPIDALRYE